MAPHHVENQNRTKIPNPFLLDNELYSDSVVLTFPSVAAIFSNESFTSGLLDLLSSAHATPMAALRACICVRGLTSRL